MPWNDEVSHGGSLKPKSHGLWSSVKATLGASWRGWGRGWSDVAHVFTPITRDIGLLGLEIAKGHLYSPKFARESQFFAPLARKATSPETWKATGKTLEHLVPDMHGYHSMKEFEKAQTPTPKAQQDLSQSIFPMVMPGIQTGQAAQTPEGRKWIASHPGYTLMDLLPYKKGIGPSVSGVLGAATAGIRRTRTAERLGARTAGLTAHVNPRAALTGAELAHALRGAHETARRSLKDVLGKGHKLTSEQVAELRDMLQGVKEPPPAGHPLKGLYDEIATHQARSGAEGLSREVPPEFKAIIRRNTLMSLLRKQGASVHDIFTHRLVKELGTEEGWKVAQEMTDAFVKDLPNPHPEFEAAWRFIKRRGDVAVTRAEGSFQTHEVQTPAGKEFYSYEQARKIGRTARKFTRANVEADKALGRVDRLSHNVSRWRTELEELQGKIKATRAAGKRPLVGSALRRTKLQDMIHRAEQTTGKLARDSEKATAIAKKNYLEVLKSNPPGRWKAVMEEADRAAAGLRAEIMTATKEELPGLRGALKNIEDSLHANWMEMAGRGIDPVYLHRIAKESIFEAGHVPSVRASVARPGSVRPTEGLAPAYERNPFVMLATEEIETAQSQTLMHAYGEVFDKFGGTDWGTALNRYFRRGFKEEDALNLTKQRYSSFEIDAGKVKIGEAGPGRLLVPKEVGLAIDRYTGDFKRTFWDKALGVWLVPVLWLAPTFHINNIIGGAMLTGLRTGLNHRIFNDIGRALKAAKEGEVLDARIPMSVGFVPHVRRLLEPEAELAAAQMVGANLRSLSERILIQPSEKLNAFFDNFYRSFTYLNKLSSGHGAEAAIHEATQLMQDWDHLLPIEQEIFQRVIPFWTWKKTMLRYAFGFPQDHPFRTTAMNWAAQEHSRRAHLSQWVDNYLLTHLPVGGAGKDGYQKYISLKGPDPFSDYANFATAAGWLQNIHPIVQGGAEFFGYDQFVGGVDAHASADHTFIDPATGREVRSYDPQAILNLMPQLGALQRALGLKPPAQNSPQGWWKWWQQYGPSLRILPGLSYVNVEQEQQKIQAAIDSHERKAESAVRNRERKRAGTSSAGGWKD